MTKRSLLCVILAAGKSTRMKSNLPKPLHCVAGEPMLRHVVRAVESLLPQKIIVVVGPDMDAVADVAKPHETIVQVDRLGTGHAVKVALAGQDLTNTDVMVLYGDVPLVPSDSLKTLMDRHYKNDAPEITILGMEPENPTGYGRLITDQNDYVTDVVEELDATPDQQKIKLCSSGMMVLRGEKLVQALETIKNNNAKGEYYMLDVLPILCQDGDHAAYTIGPSEDLNGVNDRVQLSTVERRMQQKLRDAAMRGGVTMIDPDTVYLSTDTIMGQDIVIEPNVVIAAGVKIDNGVVIKANSYLEHVFVEKGARIGPFARIRDHSVVGQNVQIGNFVEIKKSVIGQGTKANHLTYLCDLDVGENINIGVGALFSNYDGKDKHRTKIGNNSFVGANCTIVSPVTIGEDTYIAAGSTITEDIADGQLAFGRARQVNREHTEKTKQFAVKQRKKTQ